MITFCETMIYPLLAFVSPFGHPSAVQQLMDGHRLIVLRIVSTRTRGFFRVTIYNPCVAIALFIWRSVALPFSFRFDRVLKHLKSQVSLASTPREDSLYCQADLGWQASSRLSRFENRMRRMHMGQALRRGTCLSCFGCCPSHRRLDSTVRTPRE